MRHSLYLFNVETVVEQFIAKSEYIIIITILIINIHIERYTDYVMMWYFLTTYVIKYCCVVIKLIKEKIL